MEKAGESHREGTQANGGAADGLGEDDPWSCVTGHIHPRPIAGAGPAAGPEARRMG